MAHKTIEKKYNEVPFNIRSLTRKEVIELRKEGLSDPSLSATQQGELTDKIVHLVLGSEAYTAENLPNNVYVQIFVDIMGLTFGSDASEKNSQTSGGGEKAAE